MKLTAIFRNILLLLLIIGLGSFILKNKVLKPDITKYNPNVMGIRMVDVNGNIHRVGIEKGTSYPVVFIFIDVECPISQRYVPKLNDLYNVAKEKKVLFYGVISDPLTTCTEASTFKNEYKIEFPVLFDASGDMAKRLNPKTLPQCFVLNVHNEIIYNGRIDDEYVALGTVRKNILNFDLNQAIIAASKNELPKSSFEEPIGCIFESWKDSFPKTITYNRDIAPIVNANCVNCHRKGAIAPFSLLGYKNAERRSMMIKFASESLYMPIWKPTQNYGEFRDEHFLSDYQIELIEKWEQAGSPEGLEQEKIPEPTFSKLDWVHGKPDKVIEMKEKYIVPAKGEDVYRYFVIPDVFTEDKIIKALDFKPGATAVVHHVIFLLDYSGKARELDKKDKAPGFSVFDQDGFMQYQGVFAFGGWTPGTDPYILGDDVGMLIPKGADVVMEIHYHLNGKDMEDQSSIAMYFDKGKPKKYISGMIMGTKDVEIPANEKAYPKKIWMEAPADFSITDLTPHMHYIGQTINVKATYPDGTVKPLIEINEWDLRWQNIYVYREPVFIPKGTIIEANYTFNNTKDNVDNPNNPVADIGWGWGANDEMCELFLTFIPENPKDAGLIKRAALASWIHIDNLSEDHSISKKGVEQTYNELKEVDIWTEKGQALLISAYESNHIKDILAHFKKGEATNDRNKTFLTNFGVYVVLFIATKEDLSGVFWDAFKANALFKGAISLDKKDWNARYSKAYSYVETQKPFYIKQGLTDLKKLIKEFPGNEKQKYHHAYLSLAKAYNATNKRDLAKETIEKGLKLFPSNKRLTQEYVTYKY